MDLISWLEVRGVEAVTMGVISYSAVFFGDSSIREVDGQAPVEIKKV